MSLLRSKDEDEGYNVSIRYASGRVVSNNLTGPLLANSFFNPQIIKVIRYLCAR